MMELDSNYDDENVDPITDIIDYLISCSKINFKPAHVGEQEKKTSEKIKLVHEDYKKSPLGFLYNYGKHMAPQHIGYFDKLKPLEDAKDDSEFRTLVEKLRHYHSDKCRRVRIKNRRFKAMKQLKSETDYFSEKQMMYRNPLLYEQLIGQFLSDEEIRERDGADNENLTLLSMVLDTVDRNDMRARKEEQELAENLENIQLQPKKEDNKPKTVRWGEFDIPEPTPEHEKLKAPVRKQAIISYPEKQIFHEEFVQEMYFSFMEGRDVFIDYSRIDDNEIYDDLALEGQDSEDEYFNGAVSCEDINDANIYMESEQKDDDDDDDDDAQHKEVLETNKVTQYLCDFHFQLTK